ncbi:MAG: hypothetical protein CL844_03050 [Crocinitomicaceae bacterium]|nr:hypothetical protein [Crocinitomicaceae bacterium]|tara:strand:+ start:29576 stop:29860 length:285 start_codon:yes stop_codon:yes gene_type:complete
MNIFFGYLKNKFLLTTSIFLLYTLFLDEQDIFSIFSQKQKLNKLSVKKERIKSKLIETRNTLNKLNQISEVERYAREKKYFKKDNEDIFVIFSE